MLSNPKSKSVDSFVNQIITEIRRENSRFNTELRSVVRESIVLPALICNQSGEKVSAFTRDLSVAGACLITNQKFSLGDQWTIELYRMDGSSSPILADCCWAEAFGDCFWLSGWKFLQTA